MLRPRDSHDLRLLETGLTIEPAASLQWSHDVFGNSVAVANFSEPASELRIDSTLKIEKFTASLPALNLDRYAATYPLTYSPSDRTDLGGMRAPQYPDHSARLARWARAFVLGPKTGTVALLQDINIGINRQFSYQSREEEGTQTPLETLDRGWGTCRDFAVLFVEACRCLGLGARIVTGYLVDPKQYAFSAIGSGATHAWADVYLPGAGWVAFDPTSGTMGDQGLLRVAVTREIGQAIPIAGSYTGVPDDYLGMKVAVTVMPEEELKADS